MRKATAAAGALFAAGAVFSTGLVDTVARSPNRNVDLGMAPIGPNATGGRVHWAREVGRASSGDGLEPAVVAGIFIPIEPAEADPDATARELPSAPDVGPEPSPRTATSEMSDLAAVIEMPAGVELNVPIVGTISPPRFAVSDGRVRNPDLTVPASHGAVGVGVSENPEVEFSEVGAVRAHLSPVAARDIGGSLCALPRDSGPLLAMAGSTVSGARAMLDMSSDGTTRLAHGACSRPAGVSSSCPRAS